MHKTSTVQTTILQANTCSSTPEDRQTSISYLLREFVSLQYPTHLLTAIVMRLHRQRRLRWTHNHMHTTLQAAWKHARTATQQPQCTPHLLHFAH
eukprot:8772027-Pyramimonas_sp.AAC.1